MITVRKLLSIPWKTRIRKIARVLREVEQEIHEGAPKTPARDLQPIVRLVAEDRTVPEEIRRGAEELSVALASDSISARYRQINSLRHRLFAFLGHEPADWDIRAPNTGTLDRSARTVHDLFVYLEDLRSPFNIGSVFRTAESFGVRKIMLSPECPSPDHSRARRSSMGASDVVDWAVCSFEEAVRETEGLLGLSPGELPVMAVETGGTTLQHFMFPRAGMVVLGSEELGVSGKLLRIAEERAGRITIAQAGSKASLNVGVAFGIVAHAWFTQLGGG